MGQDYLFQGWIELALAGLETNRFGRDGRGLPVPFISLFLVRHRSFFFFFFCHVISFEWMDSLDLRAPVVITACTFPYV